MSRLKLIAGVVLAAGLVLPTTTAVAVTATGGGVKAWSPAKNDSGIIAVQDNSHDGDPGKAEYYRAASPDEKRTLWNHSGPGTTVYSGDGSRIYKFKACDENYGPPDDCSGWAIP